MPEASDPASDPASDGLEAIVTVTETLEELQLHQEAVESESRGAIYSIPIVEGGGGGSFTPEDPAEAPRTLLGNWSPLLGEVGGKVQAWGAARLMAGMIVLSFLSVSVMQGISPGLSQPLPFQHIPLPTLWVWERGCSLLCSLLLLTYPK